MFASTPETPKSEVFGTKYAEPTILKHHMINNIFKLCKPSNFGGHCDVPCDG